MKMEQLFKGNRVRFKMPMISSISLQIGASVEEDSSRIEIENYPEWDVEIVVKLSGIRKGFGNKKTNYFPEETFGPSRILLMY
jgi:hypothetical protein